ncbi:MAG: LysM peptidoglycan-binding domain-containing protein [Deltaproteobacteria bacterium]|nr:LysM peptidoglycan-binding domain-containing protein [Deltaproteobacteria bacterium]MBN2670181.1 LysM peptidoglycan-binding domain-containing protein [Deltaproteobacteria bacterium]
MKLHYNNPQKQLISLFIMAAMAFVTFHAKAAKQETAEVREASVYIIKDGDYLGGIAMAHGVSVAELIEANGLDNPDRIYSGMELMIPGARIKEDIEAAPKKSRPAKVTIEVPKGVTLSRIAKVYGVPVAKIMRANKNLSNPDNLQAGMKLFIPGATEEIELVPPPPCFNPAVEFYRVKNNETEMIHLTYCNGKANPAGVEKLSHFASPLNLKKMPFPLHPRLAVLLQKVADAFPGRRLEIISGQRVKKDRSHESFHNKGQAIDFRVAGIQNRTLVTFLKKFDNTGVGFYPNSVFVHLDTRKRNAFWIDYSRPGERAIYAKAGMTKEEIEEIREARRQKKAPNNQPTERHADETVTLAEVGNPQAIEHPVADDIKGKIEEIEAADKTAADSAVGKEHNSEVATISAPGQA